MSDVAAAVSCEYGMMKEMDKPFIMHARRGWVCGSASQIHHSQGTHPVNPRKSCNPVFWLTRCDGQTGLQGLTG